MLFPPGRASLSLQWRDRKLGPALAPFRGAFSYGCAQGTTALVVLDRWTRLVFSPPALDAPGRNSCPAPSPPTGPLWASWQATASPLRRAYSYPTLPSGCEFVYKLLAGEPGSAPRRRMTAVCAFETFERRLESTLTGHCGSRRWTSHLGGKQANTSRLGKNGVRAEAAFPLRARNRLQRPKRPLAVAVFRKR